MNNIPLTPKNGGGLCLSPSELKAADIIVSTTGATVSGVVRFGTGSPVSHAMLYVGGGNVVEAVGSGVREVPLKSAFNDASLAVAYRMTDLTMREAEAVIRFAKNNVGRAYDKAGAVGAGLAANSPACFLLGAVVCAVVRSGTASVPNNFYCSELVLAAFASANRPIINQNPSTSVPQDIIRAYSVGRLEYLGHLVL